MSIDVTAEVHVRRPRPEVAAYMTDPANDAEWIGGLREAHLVGEPPLAAGSRVERVASFVGRRIEYVLEITTLDPERELDMRSVKAPFPMRVTYSFEERDGGTVVRNRVRGGGGFFSLGSPLFAPMVKRNVQKDLERLRERLERG
jgi:Polyketide cyclase / dehydrase and lipid transport